MLHVDICSGATAQHECGNVQEKRRECYPTQCAREGNAIQRNIQEKGMLSNAMCKRRECHPTQCAREGNAIQRNVQEKGMLSNKFAQRENILGNQTKGSTPNAVRCITRMVMVWLLGGMVATDD
jgi:hypothetical protein